ncbi:MAG: glycosyltransferase [Nanoarchaeota archaeon]|nr:glycosyltransferase [Nanoarchaeota archaeon]
MKDIIISVIIPTYNRPFLLKECLNSLMIQSYLQDKFEVIVVDDCSNYEVSSIINNCRIKNINLIKNKKHSGKPGFVRSIGVNNSKGKIIAFIDDDFVASNDWIKNIVHYHESYKKELVIQGGLDNYDKKNIFGLLWKFILDLNIENKIEIIDDITYIDLLGTGNFSVKKKLFDYFSFDECPVTREDELLRRQLRMSGIKILFAPEIMVFNKRKDSLFSFLKQNFWYGVGDSQLKAIFGRTYHNESVSLINLSIMRKLVNRFRLKSVIIFFLIIMKNIVHFFGTLRLRSSFKTALILGIRHFSMKKAMYFNIDSCKPINVVLALTGTCNYHCVKCGIWEEKNKDVLSTDDVKKIILKLKKWLGSFIFVISGGEPMLRKDLFEIISFCNQNNILTHLVTNGSLLNQKSMRRLESSGLSFLSISLESTNPKIHDSIVGIKGSCEHLNNTIKLSRNYSFKTFISIVLMKQNLEEIKSLVRFADSYSDGIRFQCLTQKPYHDVSYNPSWYKECDLWPESSSVKQSFKFLLDLKSTKILNSKKQLKLMRNYFLDSDCELVQCVSGYQNFLISFKGDVKLCYNHPSIGNILKNDPATIWQSSNAKTLRRKINGCNNRCALLNCNFQDSLLHKIKSFIRIIGG